ncbi:baseplate J/gp47 family protein [Paenibacillus hamazuiensis]|uniref:baseplate J/gp47 family protein n=1 Tax=Paenibacillus hamazuiensis TaxID=2936508 RepID=UPI00200F7ADA|nr:baseplate J/gp47 family protein [Paenibacillus hamazuiensis]
MYENQTYQVILQRMLARIPSDIDKREGSIIYDALAPAALELAQLYAELDTNINLSFAGTSSGEYLDRCIAWSGITRKPATKAKLKGLFYDAGNRPFNIPIGKRFSISSVTFVAVEQIAAGQFVMECETAGNIGNQQVGTLLPIDYIDGLARGELTEILIPGEEKESDASLLDRYQQKVTKPVTGGNRYQYEVWARNNPGVGKAKAFPEWNGPLSVKVALLGTDMTAPSPAVIGEVAEYIESVRPIGAQVTVEAAGEVPIDVSAKLTVTAGTDLQQASAVFEKALQQYLVSLAFEDPWVRYARIANLILDTPGVLDYSNLTVNGGTGNIQIEDGNVAVMGTVVLT